MIRYTIRGSMLLAGILMGAALAPAAPASAPAKTPAIPSFLAAAIADPARPGPMSSAT